MTENPVVHAESYCTGFTMIFTGIAVTAEFIKSNMIPEWAWRAGKNMINILRCTTTSQVKTASA